MKENLLKYHINNPSDLQLWIILQAPILLAALILAALSGSWITFLSFEFTYSMIITSVVLMANLKYHFISPFIATALAIVAALYAAVNDQPIGYIAAVVFFCLHILAVYKSLKTIADDQDDR